MSSTKGNISKLCLLSPCVASTSTLLIPKKLIEKVGGWDEGQKYWQDNELIIRLAQESKFWYVNEELVKYTVNSNDNNRLSNKFFDWKKATRRFYEKHSTLFSSLSFFERVKVYQIYFIDASIRANSSNLKIRWLIYKSIGCILKFLSNKKIK